MIYGVLQSHYGQDVRYLFTEEQIIAESQRTGINDLLERAKAGESVSYWPIGGSNSGDAVFTPLDSDEVILAYLKENLGVDLEDPMLVDLAEYCNYVDTDEGCAQEYLDKFGLSASELKVGDSKYDEAVRMIADLKTAGYEDFNYDNPFYGNNREMRFSELCAIHEALMGQSRA